MGGEQLKMQQQFRITAAGFRNPSDLDLIVSLSHEIIFYPAVLAVPEYFPTFIRIAHFLHIFRDKLCFQLDRVGGMSEL